MRSFGVATTLFVASLCFFYVSGNLGWMPSIPLVALVTCTLSVNCCQAEQGTKNRLKLLKPTFHFAHDAWMCWCQSTSEGAHAGTPEVARSSHVLCLQLQLQNCYAKSKPGNLKAQLSSQFTIHSCSNSSLSLP